MGCGEEKKRSFRWSVSGTCPHAGGSTCAPGGVTVRVKYLFPASELLHWVCVARFCQQEGNTGMGMKFRSSPRCPHGIPSDCHTELQQLFQGNLHFPNWDPQNSHPMSRLGLRAAGISCHGALRIHSALCGLGFTHCKMEALFILSVH